MVGVESTCGGFAIAVCMIAIVRGIKVVFQMPLYPMIRNLDTESSKDNHGKEENCPTLPSFFVQSIYQDADEALPECIHGESGLFFPVF